MRFTLSLLVAAHAISCFSTKATAAEVNVPLSLAPTNSNANELDLTASYSTFLGPVSDSDTSILSGDIASALDLELSPVGAHVTGIRFNGGDIAASDVTFNFILVSASSSGLGGSLVTPGGDFAPVSNGSFDSGDHQLNIDRGALSGAGQTVDLSQDPVEFAADGGTATIMLDLLSALGQQRTYGVTITLPIDETVPVDDSITLTAVGNVVGVGQFDVTLPLAGDYNDDGELNAADYTAWRNGVETGASTAADYDVWRDAYAASLGSGAGGGAVVPEPAAALVAFASTLLIAATREPRCPHRGA